MKILKTTKQEKWEKKYSSFWLFTVFLVHILTYYKYHVVYSIIFKSKTLKFNMFYVLSSWNKRHLISTGNGSTVLVAKFKFKFLFDHLFLYLHGLTDQGKIGISENGQMAKLCFAWITLPMVSPIPNVVSHH